MGKDLQAEFVAEKEYRQARAKLAELTKKAENISYSRGGRKTKHGREYWASVLFTRLTVISVTILRISPKTHPIPERNVQWDFSSQASLTRNLIEGFLVFFYLCDNGIVDEEWNVRLKLIQIKDNKTRHEMMKRYGESAEELEGFNILHAELKSKIESYKSFADLPENQKNHLLKGDKDLYQMDDMAVNGGLTNDKNEFNGFYKFLSSHTHSNPVSFYRMAEQGRGNGLENELDKQYMTLALNFSERALMKAIELMTSIFPD